MNAIEKNKILKCGSYYSLTYFVKIESPDTFKKFENWLSAEFNLYLQDKTSQMTVYFPNGWFTINGFTDNDLYVDVNIIVNSKIRKQVIKIITQILSIYNDILKIDKIRKK